MSNKDNTSEIIKDFLDIWQKQFTYTSKDPEIIVNSMKMFQKAQEEYLKNTHKTENAKQNTNTDLFKFINDELFELKYRFKNIEERLSKIESEFAGESQQSKKSNKD